MTCSALILHFFSFFAAIVTRLITVVLLHFIPVSEPLLIIVTCTTCTDAISSPDSLGVGVLWLLFSTHRTVSVCPDPKGFLPLCQGASASAGHTTQSEPYLPLCCNTRPCFSIQAIQWLSVREASVSGLWAR